MANVNFHAVHHPLHIDPVNVITARSGKYSVDVPHFYELRSRINIEAGPVETIQFQDGPLSEEHIDGVHNEDLILIVMDRLQAFQAGPYACRENGIAITKLEEALMILCKRTQERRQRNVEGTSQK
jgi:hypothetical protein